MRLIRASIIACLCFAASTAFAQQPQPQQQSPSQVALQISSMLGQIQSVTSQWGPAIEALQQQNAALQRDLAAVTKERDALRDQAKQEPTK